MKTRLSRAVIAGGVACSFWITSNAALAGPQQSQQPSQSSSSQKTDKDKQSTTTPTQTASNKPLSPNEDPTMIGKRNINKGIWGRMEIGRAHV